MLCVQTQNYLLLKGVVYIVTTGFKEFNEEWDWWNMYYA
jgi:hypothetical protein